MTGETDGTRGAQAELLFTETKAARICSLVALGLVLVSGLHLVWLLVAFKQRLSALFSGMCIDLPASTRLVLSSSFAGFIVILLAGSVVKEIVVKNKLHTLIANGVVLILLGLLKVLVNMALFSPILKLMDGLYENIAR